MTTYLEMCGDGDNKGEPFDDGVFDGVSKIIIGDHETNGVVYIKIVYMKGDGDVVERHHGSLRNQQITELVFAVDYPNEYITSIDGYFADHRDDRTSLKLKFTTSLGRSSQYFGLHRSNSFSRSVRIFGLSAKGRKLVGLHGRSGQVINALGARFATVSCTHTPSQLEGEIHVGGIGAATWDDGAYDKGVNKVLVGESDGHLSYIKFYYRTSQAVTNLIAHTHGKEPPEEPKEFAMLDDDEYITSVEGTFDVLRRLTALTSLKFKTSYNRESPQFGTANGTTFILQGDRFCTKLAGFRGISTPDHLIALGAYFTVVVPPTISSLTNLDGDIGDAYAWNHGVHGGIRKIKVASGWMNIYSIEFEYVDDNENIILRGGQEDEEEEEDDDDDEFFTCPHIESPHIESDTDSPPPAVSTETLEIASDEYITSLEVGMSYHNPDNIATLSIAMLVIRTNRGTTRVLGSDLLGSDLIMELSSMEYAKRFVLQKRGHKIVGFFGRTSKFLEKIGVYLEPINDE